MNGFVTGQVRTLIKIEGLAVLITCLLAYEYFQYDWTLFLILFFLPDIAFLGYLAGPVTGAIVYNITHTYIAALACLVSGLLMQLPELVAGGVIWSAHIGFDRMLGYGLKYETGFSHTHLGLIGKKAQTHSAAKSDREPG